MMNDPETSYPARFRPGSEEAWAKRLHWLMGPVTGLLTYDRTVRWLAAITGRRRGHWGTNGPPARRFREFLTAIGADQTRCERNETLLHHYLAGNLGFRYLCIALSRAGADRIGKSVAVEGFAWLQEARRQGRGTILVSAHQNASRLIPLTLHREGIDDLLIRGKYAADLVLMGLEHVARNSRAGLVPDDQLPSVWPAESRQMLAHGGLVEVFGDVFGGTGRWIDLPFLGRRRPFKVDFAELAVETGAPVVPVAVSWRMNGEGIVRYHPPLAAAGGNEEERVESLVRQYASFLSGLWRGDPANIQARYLEHFLRLPEED